MNQITFRSEIEQNYIILGTWFLVLMVICSCMSGKKDKTEGQASYP